MTTTENILIAESLGIRASMFHRIEDYHDVVNEVARMHKKLYCIKVAVERCETFEWRGAWIGELLEVVKL